MATFDQAARQGCKVDGTGLIPWLDRFAQASMASDFAGWDDTRRTSWPGGPERTDDVVCLLRRREDGQPAHLIVEVATEPKADDVARLGVYELLLAIEVRAVLESGPRVYGVLLRLTGNRKDGTLRLTKSALHPGVLVEPIEVWLADVRAEETLALIESEEVALCILVWVVLMKGGGDPATIERWKHLVEREPDPERRAVYRHLALEFAELTPELVNWQNALEGWQVRESTYSKTIEARGEQKGEVKRARAYLLEGLQLHLKSAAPEAVRLAIEGTNDLDVLNRWFRALFAVESWDEFHGVMKQP